jgi:recombination protein RecR
LSMTIPRPIARLIEHFEKLPGIGPKTAQRLVFYLLHFPEEELSKFGQAFVELKTDTNLCSICSNVAEDGVCFVCKDASRDHQLLAVVSSPLDVIALENTEFVGVYHVLHGVINPLDNVGPKDIYIDSLLSRLVPPFPMEVILATNTSMEGESTALYIAKLIRDSGLDESKVKITRIARGLPVGGDIEYADDITLSRALEGRQIF